MTTGERIRQLRIEHDMTQEELGAKIGVQKAAIYKYETGLIVNLKLPLSGELSPSGRLRGFMRSSPECRLR